MAILLGLGILLDGTLQQVGFFTSASPGFPIPFRLMMIWLGLAITPHHRLSWLKMLPFLAAFFGAMGGPVAYWAGVRLGAASFTWPLLQASFIASPHLESALDNCHVFKCNLSSEFFKEPADPEH